MNRRKMTGPKENLLRRAGLLIEEAITLLDEAGARSDIAAHLDDALHRLRAMAAND